MVISVLHLHRGVAVTQNSKKRRDFTPGPLIAMELLFEVKIWLDTENVLLGQNLNLPGGMFLRVSFLVLSTLNHRKEAQSETSIQNFWEGLRWPEKSQTFKVCV